MTLATPEALAALLRRDKDLLLATWEQRARRLARADDSSTPVLRDDVPLLLEALADALMQPDTDRRRAPSAARGKNRRHLGAHLPEVVEEYRLLRDTIAEHAQARGLLIAGESARVLNALVDEGIRTAVAAHVARRDEAEARRRNEYLRFIVHDLRSPLAAVYYAILLAEKDLAQVPAVARVREIHAAIKRNVERMRGLIGKLLQEEENRNTPARIEPKPAVVELHPLVHAALRELSPLAAAQETQLNNEAAGGVRARADPDLLARVFRNLLVGAIERAPRGRVSAGARAAGERVECWVRDDGRPGPEPAGAAREPAPDAEEPGGAQLALATARRLVQAHGGRFEVEAREAEGTTVRFSLPGA
jgi:signal transduction histidine kinase